MAPNDAGHCQLVFTADLFCEVACTVGGVDDLVVEDGEVEGESEADGMRRLHLGPRDVERVLVRLLRALRRRLLIWNKFIISCFYNLKSRSMVSCILSIESTEHRANVCNSQERASPRATSARYLK